ncbi:MAG: FAD-dependent oxidoreductase, partial [Halobacteriaceae archaeon]
MRVVVLGGGYAGLVVATKLENMLGDADDLMVIDKTGTHLLLHELHRIIRYPQYTDLIEFKLDELLTESTTVVTDEVDNIDTASQEISLKAGNTIQYDYCAICLGSQPDYYGLQHVEQYSVPVNTIQNIETIRDSIDEIIENQGNDIIIGGGGLSGIQVAGEIQALFNTKEINIPVHLLEQQSNIAP